MWERRFYAIVLLGLCAVFTVVYYERYYEPKKVQADSFEIYEQMVAITFDDGPGPYTEALLDGLKKRGVHASFFLIGESISGREDTVLRMYKEGHVIGNHTFSHIGLTTVSTQAALKEITDTNCVIRQITGEDVRFIRPPYGMWDEKFLYMVDLTPVMWSVDPDDWMTDSVATVVKRVVDNVKDGDIILLHDIYPSSVQAALEIIDILSARGYGFVTVEDLLID